jgi:hypothetical protein
MWEGPIYKFKIDVEGKKEYILIDVTGSAPNFKEPGKQLEGTFKSLLAGLIPSETKILDFGGAKLRNTLYLLKKGYTVYACEFEDLFKRSKQANDFYEECKKFPNFKKLVFPKDFIEFNDTFDVVLLVNVINIMPVSIERYHVLALCRKKLKDGGQLLWYTQHGMYSEKDAVAKLYDGLVTGKGREYHMFYRDFTRKEIHDMLNASGFSYDKNHIFPTSGSNQAYAFKADGGLLVDKTLGLTDQEIRKPVGKMKTVQRDSWKTTEEEKDPTKRVYETVVPVRTTKNDEINVLESYLEELTMLRTGKVNASKYHGLIFNILKSVFEGRLRKPEMEEELASRTQRADITFQNQRETGFFKQLAEGYNKICPNIFIECKNYKGDIGTPEFSQIQNRLNKSRGQFGIIVCRNIINNQKAKERQANLEKDDKYVIILTDEDIQKLGHMKIDGKESEIDDFIEEKFKKLL